MKIFKKLALGLLLTVAASLGGAEVALAQARMYGSSYDFYTDLAPYGRWVSYRNFGRVWIPQVEPGFQPYATRGHWIVTEYGNTWVSDYDWGWAPFHYGRWTFDDYYGWIWIPGHEWGPAWVSWRSDNDYYGWAPLSPGVDINVNINIPVFRWIFVPKRYITHHRVYDYCLPRQRVVNVYRHTTIINNVYVNNNRRYVSGPHRDEIQRATRSNIVVHRIDNGDRPARAVDNNGSLRIYRPEFSDRNNRNSDNRINSEYRNRPTYDNNNRGQGRDNQTPSDTQREPNSQYGRTDAGSESRGERWGREQQGQQPEQKASPQRPESDNRGNEAPNNRQWDRRATQRQNTGQPSTGTQGGASSERTQSERGSYDRPQRGSGSSDNSGQRPQGGSGSSQGDSRRSRPTRG